MKVGNLNIAKRQIVIMAVLLLGLIILVILVQRQQILKSRAYDLRNSFEVSDPEGNQLNCNDTSCETNSLDIKVKVRDLNSLIED